MPSNQSGKIVEKISFLKEKVTIKFNDKSKIQVSKDTYTNYYFFEGKTFTNKQIKEIVEADKLTSYLGYAIKLCGKQLITEGKVKDKLYNKGANKKIVEKVIKILKEHDILNDDGYCLDYIEYANEKLYGQKRIQDDLIKKGVSVEKVKKLKFSKSSELKKAKDFVKELNKKNETCAKPLSYSTRKQKAYYGLLRRGFIIEVALEALNVLAKDKDESVLNKEVDSLLRKWMTSNEHKYENDNDRFKALFAHLKRKGYSYVTIRKAWESYYEFIN